MPQGKVRPTLEEVTALLVEDQDTLQPIVEAVLLKLLEAERSEALGARSASGGSAARPAAATTIART